VEQENMVEWEWANLEISPPVLVHILVHFLLETQPKYQEDQTQPNQTQPKDYQETIDQNQPKDYQKTIDQTQPKY